MHTSGLEFARIPLPLGGGIGSGMGSGSERNIHLNTTKKIVFEKLVFCLDCFWI